MGSKLRLSSAYHPQTDGHTERTIQLLKDLLRACVLEQGGSWDTYLPLIEFTYNNSYHIVLGWHLLKRCMVEDVELRYVGMSLEKV